MSSLNYQETSTVRQEPMKMATNIIIITEFCELNNYNSSNLNTKKELNFSQTTVPKRKPISINFRKDTHITERELQHRTLKRISEKDTSIHI
jgi:hypothetical protein